MYVCMYVCMYSFFVFKDKNNFSCGFWWVLVTFKWNPFVIWSPPQSRDWIGVMYHIQINKQNNPMTLSKHEATHRKANKEAWNDHALPVSQMLWNCLEILENSTPPAVDIKAGPITDRERVASRVGIRIFTYWRQPVVRKKQLISPWCPAFF